VGERRELDGIRGHVAWPGRKLTQKEHLFIRAKGQRTSDFTRDFEGESGRHRRFETFQGRARGSGGGHTKPALTALHERVHGRGGR